MRKQNIFLWMLVGCLFVLASCSDDDKTVEPSPLTVTESNVNFTAEGGTGQITVTSTTPIGSAVSSDDWCKVTNVGDYTVGVTVSENNETAGRDAYITITDQNQNETHVAVTQSGFLFNLSSHRVGFADAGGTKNVTVSHSGVVTVSSNSDWATASVEGKNLVVTTTANTTGDVREAKVMLASAGKTDSVIVVQADQKDLAGDYYYAGYSAEAKLQAINAKLEVVDAETMKLSFPDLNLSCNVAYDADNVKLVLNGGTYLGTWAHSETVTSYIYTVLWDINLGYLTWGYSVDGNFTHTSTGVTGCTFDDNGSWSGYVVSAIRFEEFREQAVSSANRYRTSILDMIYPFLSKKNGTSAAKLEASPFARK